MQEQQIQEPAQVVDQPILEPSDHIPLKDQFSSDLSEIQFLDMAQKNQEIQVNQKVLQTKTKKKKTVKNYRWKHKWIKHANIVAGSAPIYLKKWVKVKYVPTPEQLQGSNVKVDKQRDTLEMAQAIIQGQLNIKN